MASNLINSTDKIPSSAMGSVVDDLVKNEGRKRQSFERRWYDNNFFDDGFHFRYVSRDTGKIVDLSRQQGGSPLRAIPKASRQIRGIANLLSGPEYVPVIYPDKVTFRNYPRAEQDPQTGQVKYPDYEEARKLAKIRAQRIGNWLTNEFKDQEINSKMVMMMILAAKHGVSYLKIYPDTIKEEICSYVCDAFDVYLQGDLQTPYDSPFVTFTKETLIAQIKANKYFDEEQLALISPDNKYASSEIKEAYMVTRYGSKFASDHTASLVQKETYIKEYVTEDNMRQVVRDLKEGAKEIKMGDQVIRQIFSAGSITLKDSYVDLPEYPIVDFRYEPGAMYQVPLIERFIPANKTLDMIVSRVEGYANTMGVGIYQKRKGENGQWSNIPGGQVYEYSTTPLTQMNIAPLPNFMFELIGLLEKFIEEQGASTSSLGQLPSGVRSGVAIESVKSIEYANLAIATQQLKKTTKIIAERMIDLAAKYYLEPKTVELLDKGDPTYFDVIGQRGAKEYQRVGAENQIQGSTVISSDAHVDIEVESGLGFTQEGKKATMQELTNYFLELAKLEYVSPEVMKMVTEKLLEVYQFGSTQEFTEVLDSSMQESQVTDQDIEKVKVALAEVVKDLGLAGPKQEQQQVMSTKVGVVEAMKDLAGGAGAPQEEEKAPNLSIPYKDLPPEGKAQLAAQAGIQITPEQIMKDDKSKQTMAKAKVINKPKV